MSQLFPQPQEVSKEHFTTEAHCYDDINFKAVHAVVGVTCALSMVGSVLIILSYFIIPDVKTKAREILVNLSIMDFMAAAANCTGIIINFDKSLGSGNDTSSHHYMSHLCLAQATFALYGTVSSVLWTICIAVYIYLCIMLGSKLMASRSVLVFYLVSYGIPLIVTAWYIPTGKLGYDTVSGSGWCSLLVSRSYGEHSRFMPLNSIFGSDMWVYLTMFIVPVIFISLYCHLKSEVKKQAILSQNWKSTVQSVEFKFLFIPVFFILLRIWSLLFMAIVGQGKVDLPCFAVQFFIYTAGIGDSGQGFANSILYVLFTRRVRNYFLLCFLCRCGSTRKRDREGAILVGTERQTFNSSFSSDLERKDFSDDFSNSGNLTDRERERKSLLLNS